eukprot:4418461-Lingulodinium_polyedra.AAC.1
MRRRKRAHRNLRTNIAGGCGHADPQTGGTKSKMLSEESDLQAQGLKGYRTQTSPKGCVTQRAMQQQP